jgi:hypothetical protein
MLIELKIIPDEDGLHPEMVRQSWKGLRLIITYRMLCYDCFVNLKLDPNQYHSLTSHTSNDSNLTSNEHKSNQIYSE